MSKDQYETFFIVKSKGLRCVILLMQHLFVFFLFKEN